jgi:hypothetical protein
MAAMSMRPWRRSSIELAMVAGTKRRLRASSLQTARAMSML